MEPNPVLVAIKTQKGLAADLGRKLGITRNAVWMWKKVPPRHAFRVASHMGLSVEKVCPEIVPEPLPISVKQRKRRVR